MNTPQMGLVERLRNGGQPDLADMAEALVEALQEVFVIGDRLVDDVYGHEFVEKARAAIAAATGERQP